MDAKNDIRDVCSIADFIDSHNPLMVSFSVALDNWELSFEIEYISPQAFEASASSSGGLQCMNDEK